MHRGRVSQTSLPQGPLPQDCTAADEPDPSYQALDHAGLSVKRAAKKVFGPLNKTTKSGWPPREGAQASATVGHLAVPADRVKIGKLRTASRTLAWPDGLAPPNTDGSLI